MINEVLRANANLGVARVSYNLAVADAQLRYANLAAWTASHLNNFGEEGIPGIEQVPAPLRAPLAHILAESAAERLNYDGATLAGTLQVQDTLGPQSTSVAVMDLLLQEKREEILGQHASEGPVVSSDGESNQSNGDSVQLRAASLVPEIATLEDGEIEED